jgi:hypothetical protein
MNLPTANYMNKRNQVDSVDGKNRKRWILALYFCSIGGFSAGLIGLSMSALAFWGFIKNAGLINQIGMWLIVAAFLLVVFAAHAVDKIAKIDRNEKRKAFETKPKRKLYLPEKWKNNDFTQS